MTICNLLTRLHRSTRAGQGLPGAATFRPHLSWGLGGRSETALVFLLCSFLLAKGVGNINEAHSTNTPAPAESSSVVGSWIWADKTFDRQTCRFWKLVEVPKGSALVRARLQITADNSYRVLLDGRELGRGAEWRSLAEHDVALVLTPGPHVLAVEAFNDYFEGGVLAGLRLDFRDGHTVDYPSDKSWLLVPNDEPRWATRITPLPQWKPASVIAAFGQRPWDKKFTRVVREPPVLPLPIKFWRSGWFLALLLVCGVSALLCLWLLGQLAMQKRAQRILGRERARIARDIHDELGAGLTQLILLGEVAQNELPAGSDQRPRFDGICEKGRRLLRSIDEVIWTINSQRDTLRDFESYVSRYAEDFLHLAAIRCRLETDAEIPDASFELAARRNLFLAVKEALHNVVRHAGATEVLLQIHVGAQEVTVIVADDGKGFDLAVPKTERNGLSNMERRAAEVGGRCRVLTQPGAGCRVELSAPLTTRQGQGGWLWKWRPTQKM